jgi:4-diphosphocytidyl-2C-methyl-D-erythritol kinase
MQVPCQTGSLSHKLLIYRLFRWTREHSHSARMTGSGANCSARAQRDDSRQENECSTIQVVCSSLLVERRAFPPGWTGETPVTPP